MKLPDRLDTTSIEEQFVIANTPNFIVRRIKEDKAPFVLSNCMPPNDILKLFVQSIQKKPESLRELVTPYVCLVALSFASDVKFLKDALAFSPHPQYKWLRTFAQTLIDTYRPLAFVAMKPPVVANPAIVATQRPMTFVTMGPPVVANRTAVTSGSASNYTNIKLDAT